MINDIIIKNALRNKSRDDVEMFIEEVMGDKHEIREDWLIQRAFEWWQELQQDQQWVDDEVSASGQADILMDTESDTE